MKAIILAGGRGTRLLPTTRAISKQLHCVYNKPMIYYPLQTIHDMGIKEVLIIVSDKTQLELFKYQLSYITSLKISYALQPTPRGLPDAFIVGKEFIGTDDVTLILGDNVFITNDKIKATPNTIFSYKVAMPESYGVVRTTVDGKIDELIEKPKRFISNDAVVGLYVFSNKVIDIATALKPSPRGEIEIVDLIKELNKVESVKVQQLDGFWFDCGNHDDLLDCANLVRGIERRTMKLVGGIE